MTIRDASEIPRGVNLGADLCVVGGGPAGIAFALQVTSNTSLRVVLLESGGLGTNPEAQQLNVGTSIGLSYYDLTSTRHRALGGSSQKWAGWCRPQDPIDFAGRSWIPNSGWPISHTEMLPYLETAGRWCQLEGNGWNPSDYAGLPHLYLDPFVGSDVETAIWRGSPPTKFGHAYRDRLKSSRQITTVVDATAVEILTDENGHRATGVRIRSVGGNEFSVDSRAVVLCAGGLETPRLLLASCRSNPAGLGNENDNVGRYFTEHPHLVTGRIELFPNRSERPELAAIDKGLGGIRARFDLQRPQGSLKVAYTVSRARQEKDHLLNFSAHLQTVSSVSRHDSDAYQAFKVVMGNLRSPRRMLEQVRTRSLPEGSGKLVRRLVRGAPEISKLVYHEGLLRPKQLALYTQSEQSPNPESRVTIDEQAHDALGMPRIQLDWRLSRIDKDSVAQAQQIVGAHLENAGLGRLVPEPFLAEDSNDWGDDLRGGHHHLGTARMSIDPTKGVVNTNGGVHTVDDLYIADASVFPVGGYANPLLTTVAWALRLADTVGRRYGAAPPSPAAWDHAADDTATGNPS